MKTIITTLLLLFSIKAFAQDPNLLMSILIDGNDTTFVDQIAPAIIKPSKKPRGKEAREWRKQYKLVHNFGKAYPYALVAKEEIEKADKYIADNNLNSREKERYIKELQKQLFEIFEQPLKNLSFTQGRILLRLIDREIGQTSLYLVQTYRGRAAAGFWQGIGKIFGADMKKPYDPHDSDKELEKLVKIYQQGNYILIIS